MFWVNKNILIRISIANDTLNGFKTFLTEFSVRRKNGLFIGSNKLLDLTKQYFSHLISTTMT